jgi:hypothetical protein
MAKRSIPFWACNPRHECRKYIAKDVIKVTITRRHFGKSLMKVFSDYFLNKVEDAKNKH